MAIIYYQSDFCSSAVHEAHFSKPLYTFHGRRRVIHHAVDAIDNTLVNLTLGSKNSASDIKLYTKTPDIEKKGKSYISQIHNKFFETGKKISRIECCCRSEFFMANKPFGNMSVDLIDLLTPENLKRHFICMMGDKLKFRKINSIGWDKNRNPTYEKFELLSFTDNHDLLNFNIIKPTMIISQKKAIDNFKEMVYRYMEGKIPYVSILSYVLLI